MSEIKTSPIKSRKSSYSKFYTQKSLPALTVKERSPGPSFYNYSSVGKQVDSVHENPLVSSISYEERSKMPENAAFPGPGEYKPLRSIEKTFLSTKKNNPVFTMKGRENFGAMVVDKYASKTPGPGEYPQKDYPLNLRFPEKYSMGRKPLTRDSNRTPAPGKIDCNQLGEYVIPQEQTTKHYKWDTTERPPLDGKPCHALGPCEYPLPTFLDNMTESKLKSTPKFSFSKTEKLPWPKVIGNKLRLKLNGGIGKQVLSTYKTLPSSSMASRTNFGSIYS